MWVHIRPVPRLQDLEFLMSPTPRLVRGVLTATAAYHIPSGLPPPLQVICPEATETDTPRCLDRAAHQLPKQDTSIGCVAKKRSSPIAGRHMTRQLCAFHVSS